MKQIRFCEHCQITKDNTMIPIMFFSKKYNETIIKDYFAGFIYGIQESYWENTDKCPFCKNIVSSVNITEDDVRILFMVSNGNRQLLEAMIDLHDKDIIEYELKMSQFRNQVEQQKSVQNTQSTINQNSTPKCPHCNSTNIKPITTGERIGSITMLGIFSKKINKSFKCLDCKYTW